MLPIAFGASRFCDRLDFLPDRGQAPGSPQIPTPTPIFALYCPGQAFTARQRLQRSRLRRGRLPEEQSRRLSAIDFAYPHRQRATAPAGALWHKQPNRPLPSGRPACGASPKRGFTATLGNVNLKPGLCFSRPCTRSINVRTKVGPQHSTHNDLTQHL